MDKSIVIVFFIFTNLLSILACYWIVARPAQIRARRLFAALQYLYWNGNGRLTEASHREIRILLKTGMLADIRSYFKTRG